MLQGRKVMLSELSWEDGTKIRTIKSQISHTVNLRGEEMDWDTVKRGETVTQDREFEDKWVSFSLPKNQGEALASAFTETMATTHGVIKKISVSFAYLYFASSGIKSPCNCNGYCCGIIKNFEMVKKV